MAGDRLRQEKGDAENGGDAV